MNPVDQHELERFAQQMGVFMRNRQAFPPDALKQYADHWIVWHPDGTSILAASKEPDADLDAIVQAAGFDPARCVHSYIPSGDTAILGGLW
jgi:hypothetical protein